MVSLSAKQGNDEFNVFIKSSNLYIPSYSTTKFHGISNDFIEKNGVDISLALRMFCDFLEKIQKKKRRLKTSYSWRTMLLDLINCSF